MRSGPARPEGYRRANIFGGEAVGCGKIMGDPFSHFESDIRIRPDLIVLAGTPTWS